MKLVVGLVTFLFCVCAAKGNNSDDNCFIYRGDDEDKAPFFGYGELNSCYCLKPN